MGPHNDIGGRASAHAMTTKVGRTSVSASFLQRLEAAAIPLAAGLRLRLSLEGAAIVMLLAMLCASCGGGSGDAAKMRAESPALPLSMSGGGEAAATQAPVDPDLMQQLQAELTRVLAANPSRGISTPPHGERAASPLTYNAGNSSLVWGYHSPGDYDQNGIVNVSDLTPLGQNFGKVAIGGSFPLNSIEAVVDGDGNGEINLADVTPIGVNFGVQCSGYNIYVAESETAMPPTPDAPNGSGASLVDSVSFNSANQTGGRKSFTLQVVPTAQQQHFWVRSTDGKLDGAASTAVAVNLPPAQPPQAAITPTGDTGTMAHIVWDASASIDPDGEIVSYEWDFDGDGIFDYTTNGNDATADFYYYEAGQFSATVQVTDDTQRTDTATAIVNITQVQQWQETVADERLDEGGGGNWHHGIYTPVRLLEVEGQPALIYHRKQDEDTPANEKDSLVYTRALDPQGTQWTEPQYIERGSEEQRLLFWGACHVVDGLPAVAYRFATGNVSADNDHYVVYARAQEATGENWDQVNVIHSKLQAEEPPLSPPQEMMIVSGRPALLGSMGGGLDYAIARNEAGSSWHNPVESALDVRFDLDRIAFAVSGGLLTRVEQVNGEDLLFNKAQDSQVQNWTGPASLIDEHEKAQAHPRLLDVAGRPGVVYRDDSTSDLKFRRALDADGSVWGEPVIIDPRAGNSRLAAIIDGRLTLLYSDRITDSIKIIAANDAEASYWSIPADVYSATGSSFPLDAISFGLGFSTNQLVYQLTEVSERPSFCFIEQYDGADQKTGRRLWYVCYR